MSRLAVSLAVLISVMASSAVFAKSTEEGVRYSPGNRFMVMRNETPGNTKNVTVKNVSLTDSHDFIRNHVKFLTEQCTDSAANSNLVKVFTYYSDRHRKDKLQASYVLDFSGWQPLRLKATCLHPRFCFDQQCFLFGYSAEQGNKWTNNFNQMASEWNFERVGNDMVMKIASRDESCKQNGGVSVQKNKESFCRKTFKWEASGLSSVGNATIPDAAQK